MATPISPKTRLFIASSKEEDIITVQDYITQQAKASKLDEGIVKTFLHHIKAGEEVDTQDLDTPAAKKAGKALITKIKADYKLHEVNKAEWEKSEAALKEKKKNEREALKDALLNERKESGAMFSLELTDESLVIAKAQLTENALATIKSGISDKFLFDENGIISIDSENKPDKKEFAEALATVTVMVQSGQTVSDSASKTEAMIGWNAKQTLGDSWVNLFYGNEDNLSRVQKGVKVFETIAAFKSKKAKALFGKLPFNTSRALLEMKVTTAEIEGSPEKAIEKNLAAKKEVWFQAADVQIAEEEKSENYILTQREAKKMVSDYKTGLGIKPPEKMKFIHLVHLDKKLNVFGATELKSDNVRLSMLTFDYDGNRLAMSEDGKSIVKFALVGPESVVAKYLIDNAAPPELTKEQKADAALKEKEAAKAVKAAAKSKGKGKAGAADEQEEDAPSTKAVVKGQTTAVTAEDDLDDDTNEAEEEDGTVRTDSVVEADDEDDAPATKGKAIIADDDDE